MRPFNLEEYLANPSKRVVTRDGRDVTIHCTNFNSCQPIIAQIEGHNSSHSFTIDGKYCIDENLPYDLFFADDIPDFKPYDRVLTRGSKGLPWKANLFSNFKQQGNNTIAVCLKGDYLLSDIIPFDENKVGKKEEV